MDLVRARILHGRLRPGEPLPTEQALADDLQVSRGTVREALARLAAAGLVRAPHGAGKVVLDFRTHAGLEVLPALLADPEGHIDLDVVQAATEMRAALAPDVARLAALRHRPGHEAALTGALERLVDSGDDLSSALQHSVAWWSALVQASGNIAYRLAFNSLLATYTEGSAAMRAIIAAELLAHAHYARITAAVLRREAAEAERGTRTLVALGTDALVSAITAARAAGGPR